MAHKKGVGSSKNGRESASQRHGVKNWGGQKISAGTVGGNPVTGPGCQKALDLFDLRGVIVAYHDVHTHPPWIFMRSVMGSREHRESIPPSHGAPLGQSPSAG